MEAGGSGPGAGEPRERWQLGPDGSRGGGETKSSWGQIWKVEPTGFANRLAEAVRITPRSSKTEKLCENIQGCISSAEYVAYYSPRFPRRPALG